MFIKLFGLLSIIEDISIEIILAVFVIPVAIVLFFYFKYAQGNNKVGSGFRRKIRPLKYNDAQANGALLKYFPYYQDLDKNLKKRFLERVKEFMQLKEFILSGVKDPNDGINLGLHEMAHALNVHAFEETDHHLEMHFYKWSDEAILEMGNIEVNPNHFLRKYAATNIEEMFAVCTENFFERPEEFSKVLPKLYKKLSNLYKQDPRNHANPVV